MNSPAQGVTAALLRSFALLAVLALLTGCAATRPSPSWSKEQGDKLSRALVQLGDRVAPGEADRLAQAAVGHAAALQQEYRAVWPPRFHNHLVNAGYRERGLCYHWANDLFTRLHELYSQTLELHLAVARMDTSREHNAVIVTARGQPFSEGIVLDAWRHSGRLWWERASDDRYPWQPLPYERTNPALQNLVNR